MSSLFSVDDDNNLIIGIEGEIHLDNTSEYKAKIKEAIEKGSYKAAIVDLEKTSYIDSSGIGMFLYLKQLSKAQGMDFYLRSPLPEVLQALKLGHFDKIFKFL